MHSICVACALIHIPSFAASFRPLTFRHPFIFAAEEVLRPSLPAPRQLSRNRWQTVRKLIGWLPPDGTRVWTGQRSPRSGFAAVLALQWLHGRHVWRSVDPNSAPDQTRTARIMGTPPHRSRWQTHSWSTCPKICFRKHFPETGTCRRGNGKAATAPGRGFRTHNRYGRQRRGSRRGRLVSCNDDPIADTRGPFLSSQRLPLSHVAGAPVQISSLGTEQPLQSGMTNVCYRDKLTSSSAF